MIDNNDKVCEHRADDWVTNAQGEFICPKCNPELVEEDEDEKNDASPDYPLGGSLEPYDIERDKEILD